METTLEGAFIELEISELSYILKIQENLLQQIFQKHVLGVFAQTLSSSNAFIYLCYLIIKISFFSILIIFV